jgi:hypothetical protein
LEIGTAFAEYGSINKDNCGGFFEIVLDPLIRRKSIIRRDEQTIYPAIQKNLELALSKWSVDESKKALVRSFFNKIVKGTFP